MKKKKSTRMSRLSKAAYALPVVAAHTLLIIEREVVAGYQCSSCDRCFEDGDTDLEPLYECSSCGATFLRSNSADGESNRCTDCHKFAAKSVDLACPDCEEEVEPCELVENAEGEFVPAEDEREALNKYEFSSGGDARWTDLPTGGRRLWIETPHAEIPLDEQQARSLVEACRQRLARKIKSTTSLKPLAAENEWVSLWQNDSGLHLEISANNGLDLNQADAREFMEWVVRSATEVIPTKTVKE